MNSTSDMYECFARTAIDSFHTFLTELEKSDIRIVSSFFMNKLREINTILNKLFEERTSSTSNVAHAKEILAVSPESEMRKRKISTRSADTSLKRNDSTDENHNRGDPDVFKRAEKYIRRDVDSTGESDDETKSSSSNSVNELFKTDYPDECFEAMNWSKSVTDNPYIRKIATDKPHVEVVENLNYQNNSYIRKIATDKPNVEGNRNVKDQNDPYVVKVAEEYQCQLCSISHMSKHDVTPHVLGRQHQYAKEKKCELKRELKKTEMTRVRNEDAYQCSLCETIIMGLDNTIMHINGKKHQRKLKFCG